MLFILISNSFIIVILDELIKTLKNPNLQYGKHQYISTTKAKALWGPQ